MLGDGSDSEPLEPRRRGSVLVVDKNAGVRQRTVQILAPVVGHIEVCEAPDSLPRDGEFDLVAVNYDELHAAEREALVKTTASSFATTRLLLSSRGSLRDDYPALFSSRGLTNLIARNDAVDPQEYIVTVQKILRRDIFGLEKYFAWGVEPLSWRLSASKDKREVLERAGDYVAKIGMNSRFLTHVTTVLDELITNAFFNAPTDADGGRPFAAMPRTAAVQLSDGAEVTVKLCYDGRRVGVSVADPFGSLTQSCILDYLAKCFRKGTDQVDEKAGGAGLGLFYIFDALSHFVVNISPGRRTEMIGLITLASSFRDFVSAGKSFNIFVTRPS